MAESLEGANLVFNPDAETWGRDQGPGVFTDISHQEYLENDRWVSSSMLKRFLPEFFKPFNGSPSADIGSVLHQRFTGEDVPVVVVDAATWVGKAAQEARTQAVAAGHYAILSKDVDTIDRMETALRKHPEASRLLVDMPGTFETSVYANVDGVPSKCRFDKLVGTIGVDIKTTKEQPGESNLAKVVTNYGYELSADHYTQVAEAAGIPLDGFKFVFVMNCEPFSVTVATLDETFMERGRVLRDLALSRFLHPEFVDPYPGATGSVELSCPRWAELS